MGFVSILGNKPFEYKDGVNEDVPEFFMDLNLDQLLELIVESKREYGIEPFFYRFVDELEGIRYRQDVFKDLEDKKFFDGMVAFGRNMLKVHELKRYYDECKEDWPRMHWHLDFAAAYCKTVNDLRDLLAHSSIHAEGFFLLRDWVNGYWESDDYQNMNRDTNQLLREFDTVRYSLEIDRDKVLVNHVPIEEDYCKRVMEIFGEHEEIPYMDNPLAGSLELPYLEQRILGVLMKPYKEIFVRLTEYCDRKIQIMDVAILRFEKEIQFYLSFLLFKNRLEAKGFLFAYPKVGGDEFHIRGLYDIALAWKNLLDCKSVVCNDAYYKGEERFFVVTGPNQGGEDHVCQSDWTDSVFYKDGDACTMYECEYTYGQ